MASGSRAGESLEKHCCRCAFLVPCSRAVWSGQNLDSRVPGVTSGCRRHLQKNVLACAWRCFRCSQSLRWRCVLRQPWGEARRRHHSQGARGKCLCTRSDALTEVLRRGDWPPLSAIAGMSRNRPMPANLRPLARMQGRWLTGCASLSASSAYPAEFCALVASLVSQSHVGLRWPQAQLALQDATLPFAELDSRASREDVPSSEL